MTAAVNVGALIEYGSSTRLSQNSMLRHQLGVLTHEAEGEESTNPIPFLS